MAIMTANSDAKAPSAIPAGLLRAPLRFTQADLDAAHERGVQEEREAMFAQGFSLAHCRIAEHLSLERRVAVALSIDPAAHATTSRDYGRGFAEAVRLMRAALGAPSELDELAQRQWDRWKAEGPIHAIKHLRQETGVDLRTAKDAIDRARAFAALTTPTDEETTRG